jgi:HK97 family phage major capsid protein
MSHLATSNPSPQILRQRKMQCEDQQQPASMQDGMVSDIVPATERNAVMEEEQIAPEEQITEEVVAEEIVAAPIEEDRFSRDKMSTRSIAADNEVVDQATRRVKIAVSSEAPVERSFGIEILDHNEGSVDLSFLNSGRAPLLLDHDPTKQIGVIESANLDGSARRLRATVRFGKNGLAEEVFGDVTDGIRGNISVGYQINKMDKEGRETYRATSWTPMEVSVVSIPADRTVGVGRSAGDDLQTKSTPIQIKEAKMADVDMEAVKAEAARAASKETAEMFRLAAKHNKRELADKAVAEGKSLAQFRGELLDVIGSQPLDVQEIGLAKKEVRNFSLMRAIRAMANPTDLHAQREAGFEFEASAAAQQLLGREARGLMIPADVLRQWGKRDLNTSDDSAMVAEDFRGGDFIDVLRNASSVMAAGATMLSGLQGNVAIPKKATASAGGWISSEGGAASESEPTFGQVTMTPKTIGAFTDITRLMMMQSSLDIENLIRNDLSTALALAIDLGALAGSGSSGQPTGIKNTSGINNPTDFAAAVPTFAEVVAMETAVAEDNALMGNLAYILPASMYGALKTTTKDSGSGQFVVEPGNTINGYRAIVSNQVTSGDLYFGNFSDLLIGMYGGLDITVDPYTSSSTGTVRIVALQTADVAVRHAVSFAFNNDGA